MIDFELSTLSVTNEFYAKYVAVCEILDDNLAVVEAVHKDLERALESAAREDRSGNRFEYTSDTVLRIIICQIVESLSLRRIVIRIDDSLFLRRFVRIYDGPMMDYTTLCKLKNCISQQTWHKVNRLLARYAIDRELIEGDRLRLDTTAVETNIHWPTDSSLLWDTFRVLSRLIERAREIDPTSVGNRRLHNKKAKKLATKIARKASKNPGARKGLEHLYLKLIEMVTGICEWGEQVHGRLEHRRRKKPGSVVDGAVLKMLAEEIAHVCQLGRQVIDQASRRVLHGEQVPNDEKLFSIFEPHTELLKRGKAAKPVEFGHMIQIQQVSGVFITGYDVFEKKPVEHQLLEPALQSHKKLFGEYPACVAADKGYYENMEAITKLEKKIELVSIAKKGSRTEEQALREADSEFRSAQRFRAGVEGTISFLKRSLRLFRCFSKGWEHYASTVGATIFAHNLLVLARE